MHVMVGWRVAAWRVISLHTDLIVFVIEP